MLLYLNVSKCFLCFTQCGPVVLVRHVVDLKMDHVQYTVVELQPTIILLSVSLPIIVTINHL